jgi:hypothetical protein
MGKFALLVGLESVDPVAYAGWNGKAGCAGCELDVSNVKKILMAKQLAEKDIVRLKTQEATAEKVIQALTAAALRCKAGDLFVFYYSGHGGQVPDKNNDESDGKDETLVCYNRELVDDELGEIWPLFAKDVRIVMISDSCNSGSNFRAGPPKPFALSKPIKSLAQTKNPADMKAMLIHLAACRDGSTSEGYESGGAFTEAFCNVVSQFQGTYAELQEAILEKTKNKVTQQAEYAEYGPTNSAAFKKFAANPIFTDNTTVSLSENSGLTLFPSVTNGMQTRSQTRNHASNEPIAKRARR